MLTTNYYKNDMMLEIDSKYWDFYSLNKYKEFEIPYKLKSKIMPLSNRLPISYPLIGHINVMMFFPKVSFENKFIKPMIIDKEDGKVLMIDIKGSFHSLIEKSNFIHNELIFDKSRVVLITSPNYSGI